MRIRVGFCSEETANCVTHALGLALSLIGAPVLLTLAFRHGDRATVAACAVYAASLVLLYAASTAHHTFTGRAGAAWRELLDHVCIYLLIAGTYTPVCVAAVRGGQAEWGWGLLTTVWILGSAGIAYKLARGVRRRALSLTLYVLMGWLGVVAVRPLATALPGRVLLLLLAGGVAYTAGVAFYARWIRVRYAHAIWHLHVVAGSVLHYAAVTASVRGGGV